VDGLSHDKCVARLKAAFLYLIREDVEVLVGVYFPFYEQKVLPMDG
jgi:hypothetical protein